MPINAGRRMVVTLGAMSALLAAGYGVMFSVLDDFRDQYGIGEGLLGLVVATGFFTSFGAQVLIAPLADRGHAKRLVVLGLLANIAGLLLMAYGTSVLPLLIGRLVMGLGPGMALPAVRRIVVTSDPENVGHNMGLLLSADVGGFALGPALSAVMVGPLGLPAPFLVVAAASACFVPLVLGASVRETDDPPSERFAFDLLGNPRYLSAVVLGCAVFLMIGTFDALWVLVLDDLRSPDWIANAGIIVFALPLFFLGPFGGRLAERLGPMRLGTFGLSAGAVFMFLYGRWPTGGLMLAAGCVHALNDGLTVSSTSVAVAKAVDEDRQAGGQGLMGGLQTITGGVTAVAAGFAYQQFGRGTAYAACAAAMGALIAASVLIRRRDDGTDHSTSSARERLDLSATTAADLAQRPGAPAYASE